MAGRYEHNLIGGRVPMGRRSFLGGVVVAALGLTALAGCGSTGQSTATLTQVTDAAYRSTRGPGFKFSLDMHVSISGHDLAFGGEGALDEKSQQGTMTMNVSGKTIYEVIKSPYVYVKAPSGSSAGGKPWVKLNANVFAQASGFSSAPTSDPTHMLDLLKASGQVERLGTVTIRGVSSRQYHAIVNLDRYLSKAAPAQRASAQQYAALLKRMTGSSSLPMDVFVDTHGRVRRLSLQMSFCTPEGKASESMTMDLYDYGRQAAVTVPAASQVTDVTEKVRSQISQALKQLSC